MNKKTILFLINGFGVEKKESYSIYDEKIMPNFDKMTKEYLFSNNSITSKVNNYYDAYRNISLDVEEIYNYTILDKEIEDKTLLKNEKLLNIKNDRDSKNGNLHIFCLVDTSLKIVDHLKEVLKILNPNLEKKVFLHLIISSSDIEDYKYLVNIFSHINMDLSPYAEIGFIMGLSAIDNNAKQNDLNFFFKMFISKVGEKWQSFKQRFDILYGMKTPPRDTKPFIVNSNFDLLENDTFLFFNYDNINLTNFMNTLSSINYGEKKNNYSYYSLFKITSNIEIPYLYEASLANNYLVSNLESINAKALIICKLDKVSIINYFCNGLRNESSDTLTFVDITPYENSPESIVSIVNQFDKDLIIINYDIDDIEITTVLKQKLTIVDNTIKLLNDNRNGSKYTLIVSSLYGMNKVLKDENDQERQVIFSNKMPFLYIDDFITKKDYLVEPGGINDITKTVYKSINNTSKYDSIVEKKNALYKIFFK